MKRSERIRTAVNLGLSNVAVTFGPADRIPTEFLAELRDGVLKELSKISVVPDYVPVDGVDYSVEGIEAVRAQLVELRNHAMDQAMFEWATLLTHALVLLSFMADIIKEHNDAE